MAISTTFTWTIQNCERDLSDGFITSADFTLTGVAKSDGVGIATYKYENQTAGFGTVRPSPMIAYADVTQANVISWVQTSLGTTSVGDYQDSINEALSSFYNPSPDTTGEGIPW
tara:strand:+ start:17 stop:358 length:342 start_codon:yes stop_codon:yes gene_type:complete